MTDEKNFIHLLANPFHKKKNVNIVTNDIENELYSFITSKFKRYVVSEVYKGDILCKLEKILFEKTIESTVNDIVEILECSTYINPLEETL